MKEIVSCSRCSVYLFTISRWLIKDVFPIMLWEWPQFFSVNYPLNWQIRLFKKLKPSLNALMPVKKLFTARSIQQWGPVTWGQILSLGRTHHSLVIVFHIVSNGIMKYSLRQGQVFGNCLKTGNYRRVAKAWGGTGLLFQLRVRRRRWSLCKPLNWWNMRLLKT